MSKNFPRILYGSLIGLALILLATQLIPLLTDYVTTETRAIRYPYSIDYGEGPLLDQTLRMTRFENIYRGTLASPPFTISNYPPLFPLVQVPFAWIFGPAFWYGRLINFLAVLLSGLFLTLTLKALTRDWIGPISAGLFLIGFPYLQHWALFNRIDELALVLSWAALFVSVRFLGRLPLGAEEGGWKTCLRQTLRSKAFWTAALLFVASIYTRQTYALAAPFAAFFWLIFGTRGSGRLRVLRAVLLGAVVGGVTLALFLILNLLTGGGFYLNIVVANVNPFYWDTVKHYELEIYDRLGEMLFLAVLFLLCEAIRGAAGLLARFTQKGKQTAAPVQPGPDPLTSWALVLPYLLAAAAGSITIGKDGSNVNYLLELCAGLSLAAGAMLAWAWQWKRLWVRGLVQLAVIALLALQAAGMLNWVRNDFVTYMDDRESHQTELSSILQLLKEAPGPVLADEYMGLVPLAGKRLYLQPFEFKQLADAKVWDETPFLSDITSHKFDIILWYIPGSWPKSIEARWTQAQRRAIETNYVVDQKIGDIFVYRPKK